MSRDTRDRLGAEWNFIAHAWSRGIRNLPEPLACDAAEHAGLYGFVPGRKLTASEVTPAHVDAAIDFVLAVNARPRPALAAGIGSLLLAFRTYRDGGTAGRRG